jgi:hypothetical protein
VVIGYLLGADMERVIKLDDVGVCVRIMEVVSCAITADDDVLWHHAPPGCFCETLPLLYADFRKP